MLELHRIVLLRNNHHNPNSNDSNRNNSNRNTSKLIVTIIVIIAMFSGLCYAQGVIFGKSNNSINHNSKSISQLFSTLCLYLKEGRVRPQASMKCNKTCGLPKIRAS